MSKKYLIIGQGIAGSFLAWELARQNQTVVMIDNEHKESSSMISAGMINPVTGKKFVLTQDYETYYSYARKAYFELEYMFNEKLFDGQDIIRVFKDQEEVDAFQSKYDSGELKEYFGEVYKPNKFKSILKDPFGSVMIQNGGQCLADPIMRTFKKSLERLEILREEEFSFDDLNITKDKIKYGDQAFDKVIFCDGFRVKDNPLFDWIPQAHAKGEIVKIKMNDKKFPQSILIKGQWCVPLGDSIWLCGSNYEWDQLDCQPSEEGKEGLLKSLDNFIQCDYQVIDHRAAVRPVFRDRKPVLGLHPKHSNVGIFNGLGSKGFLKAPYLSQLFVEFLVQGTALPKDLSAERFS